MHILTFKTSDLLRVQNLSCWQQFIPTYTDNKISQQISLIFSDDTFHLWWRHCHVQAYTDYTSRKSQLENKSFSKKMDRWIICVAYCKRLAESFKIFWNKNSQTISTRLARHHLQRFSASAPAASTLCMFSVSWIAITLALFQQCLICIQIFGSLFSYVNMKDANVEQEAASAVASLDT